MCVCGGGGGACVCTCGVCVCVCVCIWNDSMYIHMIVYIACVDVVFHCKGRGMAVRQELSVPLLSFNLSRSARLELQTCTFSAATTF